MGNRRIDLHRFQRLVALLFFRQELEGTRIMQPVGKLDQDHTDILRHRHKHFAKVFHLFLLFGILQHPQPCYTVYQLCNRCSKFILDLFITKLGILNAVMQQPCADGVGVEPHFNDDFGNRDRMDNIRLPITPLLALMGGLGAIVGSAYLTDIRERVLNLNPFDQESNSILHLCTLPILCCRRAEIYYPSICGGQLGFAICVNVASTTDWEISAFPSWCFTRIFSSPSLKW